MNFWGIDAPEFLTFLVRSITWLGLPSLVHERKAGCWNRWMKHLRFIIIVVFIYNPASASSALLARISLTSPPVQHRDVTVGNAGADLCHFCFGSRWLPVNMLHFRFRTGGQCLWRFYWRSLSWQLVHYCVFDQMKLKTGFLSTFVTNGHVLVRRGTGFYFCQSDSEVTDWMTQVHERGQEARQRLWDGDEGKTLKPKLCWVKAPMWI